MKTIIFAVVVASLLSGHGVQAYFPDGFETVTCEYVESLEKLIEAAEDVPNYINQWNAQMARNMIYNARAAKTEIEAGDALASLEELNSVTSWARRIIERENCQMRDCLKSLHDISQQASDAAYTLLNAILTRLDEDDYWLIQGHLQLASNYRAFGRWYENVQKLRDAVSILLESIGESTVPPCVEVTEADYPNGFCDGNPFTLNGNTADYPRHLGYQDQCGIRLTPNIPGVRASSAFMTTRMNEKYSFRTEVGYRMYGQNQEGDGDGMTFTMHQDPRGVNALGFSGGALGVYSAAYYTNQDVPAIAPALVVEIDGYYNPEYGDSGGRRIHVQLVDENGYRQGLAQEWAPLRTGEYYIGRVWVDYDGESRALKVYHRRSSDVAPAHPLITTYIDLASFFTGNQVFVGVTGSTWTYADYQDLMSFTFSQ